jgi:hypothetical protein
MITSSNLNKLSCRIFLEADCSMGELAKILSSSLPVEIESGPAVLLIKNQVGEVELRNNKEWNTDSARRFPDGFLHFRYVLELYLAESTTGAAETAYVSQLLKLFWSSGFPAVASSDYEGQLPCGGGYRDSSLPWPCDIHHLPEAQSCAVPSD